MTFEKLTEASLTTVLPHNTVNVLDNVLMLSKNKIKIKRKERKKKKKDPNEISITHK